MAGKTDVENNKKVVKFTIDDLIKSKDFLKYNRHFAKTVLRLSGKSEYTKAEAHKLITDYLNKKL